MIIKSDGSAEREMVVGLREVGLEGGTGGNGLRCRGGEWDGWCRVGVGE